MSSLAYLEDSCERIDASVFSGELLWIDEQRAMLKAYVARWQRAIENHERDDSYGHKEGD